MKKIMFILLGIMLFGPMRPAHAEGTLLDQFYAGFVGNAKLAIDPTKPTPCFWQGTDH